MRRLNHDGNDLGRSRQTRGEALFWMRIAPALFILFWSSGFTFVKMGLAFASPMIFLALRYVLVLALLVPLCAFIRPPLPKTGAAWRDLAVVGLFVHVLYFGLVYIAVALGMSAGGMGLIASLQPILVAVIAPRTAGNSVGAMRWIGLMLGVIGTAVVIWSRATVEASSVLSVACAVGAITCLTLGTLYEKRIAEYHHPLTSNLVQYLVGLVAAMICAYFYDDLRVVWSTQLLISVGYLAIANSLISTTLLLGMFRRSEALRVSTLFFLIPPASAMTAWALLGETLPLLGWVGVAMATIGVWAASRITSFNGV